MDRTLHEPASPEESSPEHTQLWHEVYGSLRPGGHMTQADLFTDTRRASLDSVTPRIAGIQMKILDALEDRGGLTTEELSTVTGIAYSALQPRTSELRDRGGIIDSGHRRPNRSGKSAIVWKART